MYTTGKIVSWDEEKGYGFALISATGVKIFVHQSELKNTDHRLAVDQRIEFVVSEQEKGKPRVIDISILHGALRRTPRKVAKWPLLFALLAIGALSYLLTLSLIPVFVGLVYAFMSCLAFILYAKDKRAAKNDQWRVSEFSLQCVSLLCGWPGALIGRVLLRHKVRKTAFSLTLLVCVLLNITAFSWLLTEQGQVLASSFAINLSFYLSDTGLFDIFKVWLWKAQYYWQKLI